MKHAATISKTSPPSGTAAQCSVRRSCCRKHSSSRSCAACKSLTHAAGEVGVAQSLCSSTRAIAPCEPGGRGIGSVFGSGSCVSDTHCLVNDRIHFPIQSRSDL